MKWHLLQKMPTVNGSKHLHLCSIVDLALETAYVFIYISGNDSKVKLGGKLSRLVKYKALNQTISFCCLPITEIN